MSAAVPRVVVDPVTRIEGHLRIEAATDAPQLVPGTDTERRGPRPAAGEAADPGLGPADVSN